MVYPSIINWILNMVFDIIVIKMYQVYSTFHATSREEAQKIQQSNDRIVFWFCITYLGFGVALNIFSA